MGTKITKRDCDAVDGEFRFNSVCIVKEEQCERDGNIVSCQFWGKDKPVKFESNLNVKVVSQLLNPIHEHENPNLVHYLEVESPTEFDVRIWEFEKMYFEDIQTRSKPVKGRLKVAKRKLDKKDISDEAVKVIHSIGEALDDFGVQNTRHLTGLQYIDSELIVSKVECPACGGLATYTHYGSFNYMPSKKCDCCGWTGDLEMYGSDTEPVSIQVTNSVRDFLEETGVDMAFRRHDDVYEAIFNAGYEIDDFIDRMQELAKKDIEACGVVS